MSMKLGEIILLRSKADGACSARRFWQFLGYEGSFALLGDPSEEIPIEKLEGRRTLQRVLKAEVESRDWITLREYLNRTS
jgi:hypothetical protein